MFTSANVHDTATPVVKTKRGVVLVTCSHVVMVRVGPTVIAFNLERARKKVNRAYEAYQIRELSGDAFMQSVRFRLVPLPPFYLAHVHLLYGGNEL